MLTTPEKIEAWEKVLESLEEIDKQTHHFIPYYAYGDNEAACEMSHRIDKINESAQEATAFIQTKIDELKLQLKGKSNSHPNNQRRSK